MLNSKSGFSNPLKPKTQREKDKPVDGKNSPWDFRAPCYDQRSSNFIQAGTNYGVGHNNPVGHSGNAKMRVDTLPYGHVNTMGDDENK